MKNKLFLITLNLTLVLSAKASVDLSTYQSTIVEINKLEQAGQYQQATLIATMASNQIATGVGFDEVVATVDNFFHERRQEVVTGKRGLNAGFSIFFGMLKGVGYSSWDAAQIMTTNPEEVAGFSREELKSFRKLQKNLVDYFKSNELAIFYAKIFAAKALQLAGKIPSPELLPLVTKTALRLSHVSFLGIQNITRCITTDYVERSRKEGFSISGILALHYDDSEEQLAHSETTCSTRSNSTRINEKDIISGKLFIADLALKTESKILSFHQLSEEAPDYPTWGLK